MGHHAVGLDLCGSRDAHLIYWTCTREQVTYEIFFYNRVGLCQLSAYEGELDFGAAVGRNQVLLGGNMGYEISYMACDGSSGGQGFQVGLPRLFSYTERVRNSFFMPGPRCTPAAAPVDHGALRMPRFQI